MNVEIKPINGFPDYDITDHGVVYSRRKKGCKPRELTPLNNGAGYYQVTLYDENNAPHKRYIHRLVAEHFLGEIPEGMEVNHIDSRRSNNSKWNLEYVTRKQNIHHAISNGNFNQHKPNLGRKGGLNPLSKKYLVIAPDGQTKEVHGLKEFCRHNNLDDRAMNGVSKGKRPHHKGWKCFKIG